MEEPGATKLGQIGKKSKTNLRVFFSRVLLNFIQKTDLHEYNLNVLANASCSINGAFL